MINLKCKVFLFVLFSVLSFLPIIVYSQKSIGKVEPATKTVKPIDQKQIDIPVNQWVGKKFIFLEQSRGLQKYGYHMHLLGKQNIELETDVTRYLRYDKFVKKIITVKEVKEENLDYVVIFAVDDSDIEIYEKTYKGYLLNLA